MSRPSFSARHRRRATIVATVLALLAALASATPAGASLTGNEPITTIAGTGNASYGGDNGPATNADLYNPFGIAIDGDGNLYIADTYNHRIRHVDTNGIITTIAGTGSFGPTGDGGPATSATLSGPSAIAVDNDGNLYIADTGNHRIRHVDTNGTITTIAGTGSIGSDGDGGPATNAEFINPSGVAVDNDGNLYIADTGNHRIRHVDTNGTITTIAGNGSTGSDGDGGPATNAQLDNPYDVAVGTNGNVYIADTVNNRIRHVDTNGIITTIAGTASSGFSGDNGPATNASLAFPLTIAVDNDSNLYIADTGGHRIRQIDTNGIITTIAGTGNTGFSGDNGPATNATLTNSSGIAVGADGSLYIADAGSHRVRVVVVDTTDPAIDLTGVNDGATITNGANATLGFTCTDTGGSGLDTCTATVDGDPISNGAVLDTTTDGAHTLEITAVDLAGNTTTETITYTVLPAIGPRELTGDYAETSGTNGSVARLYMAVFNRQPDGTGYQFWVNAHQTGDWTLRGMAAHFITSPEFVDTYGNLDDTQFIDQLYQNVLTRPGDPQGLAFWNQQIANGMTRADIVLHFSESPEFKTLTGTN